MPMPMTSRRVQGAALRSHAWRHKARLGCYLDARRAL